MNQQTKDILGGGGKLVIARLPRSYKCLILSCMLMKNDQTYFKSLLVFKP